jgi:DNA-binding Lrp family transcriptional regulator
MAMDAVDRQILEILQEDGRITNAELANRVGLTPGPVLARVNKLEETGYITGYRGLVDPEKVGLSFSAFVAVILRSHGEKECQSFIDSMKMVPEVQEVHHIAGDEDYLLKVVATSARDYERLLLDHITGHEHVRRVKTILVLSTQKFTTTAPIKKDL